MERKAAEPRRNLVARAAPAQRASNPVAQLQRTVGNRNMQRVLAREPAPAKQKTATHIELTDVGLIELLSWSVGTERSQGTDRQLHVSSKPGEHSQALMRLMMDGRPVGVILRSSSGERTVEVTMKAAHVTSFSQGGSGDGETVETWSLVGEMEWHNI